jgi:hypothetical protein
MTVQSVNAKSSWPSPQPTVGSVSGRPEEAYAGLYHRSIWTLRIIFLNLTHSPILLLIRFGSGSNSSTDSLLRENAVYDISINVGQSEVSTAIGICQLLMIDAKHVQDGGMKVVHMHRFFNRFESKIVRCAIG